jgi:hypothetical protein
MGDGQKTEELCSDECTLKRCVEGYARFLADCKQAFRNGQQLPQTGDRGEEGPTYDIDLMWYLHHHHSPHHHHLVWVVCCSLRRVLAGNSRHAHMMHPVAYRRDCLVLGVNLDHLPWPHHH